MSYVSEEVEHLWKQEMEPPLSAWLGLGTSSEGLGRGTWIEIAMETLTGGKIAKIYNASVQQVLFTEGFRK